MSIKLECQACHVKIRLSDSARHRTQPNWICLLCHRQAGRRKIKAYKYHTKYTDEYGNQAIFCGLHKRARHGYATTTNPSECSCGVCHKVHEALKKLASKKGA